MAERLQILVDAGRQGALCAGLPAAVRAAHRAAEELPQARIVAACPGRAARRWKRQLEQARAVSGPLDAEEPLLVLSPEGFPEPGALARLVEAARGRGGPVRALHEGRAAAVYLPRAGELAALPPAEAAGRALERPAPELPLEGWTPAFSKEQAAAAERALCASLAKDTDGYLARLDRHVSVALSRVLLRLPVTPNAITTASLVLGLWGAWLLASGAYGRQLAGAFLLWFCCILDGCDGEVARLKLLRSKAGAAYDLWADHAAHLATFAAVPLAVHRAHPQFAFRGPAVLLISGFLFAGFSVWKLVLSVPEKERGPRALIVERLASRDYVYLLAALTAARRLEWFLWTAGAGAYGFGLILWALAGSSRRAVSRPLPSA